MRKVARRSPSAFSCMEKAVKNRRDSSHLSIYFIDVTYENAYKLRTITASLPAVCCRQYIWEIYLVMVMTRTVVKAEAEAIHL